MKPHLPIPRVSLSSPADALPHIHAQRPVVFSGAARMWPATGRWTPERLAADLGAQPVRLYEFTRRDALPCTLAEHVHYMLTGQRPASLAHTTEPLYLAWDASILKDNPQLHADFDFGSLWGPRTGIMRTGFWMGGPGGHTPLHIDVDAINLHAVLHGQKHFLLYAPDQSPNLYPSDVYEWTTIFSQVDVRRPDLTRFPRAAQAQGVEATLEAGDILFLPIGWWHAVSCLKPSISLNAWHIDIKTFLSPNIYRDIARLALHRVGLHARDRCTCHGHGSLAIHHGWT
jgi:hypothetical protein